MLYECLDPSRLYEDFKLILKDIYNYLKLKCYYFIND